MKKNKTDIKALDELNKGACMGMDAIEFIIEKVKDESLKKELKKEYDNYDCIVSKIDNIYEKYCKEKAPSKTSAFNNAMTWLGIEKKTFMNTSNSKIAELLLQGTNMGIIEGRKLLNHKDVSAEINSLIDEFVNMQEKAVENLKTFL